MTNLWFIITMFGEIGAIFGPLPYDMVECQRRADDFKTTAQGKAVTLKDGTKVTGDDLDFYCLSAEAKPQLGSRWK